MEKPPVYSVTIEPEIPKLTRVDSSIWDMPFGEVVNQAAQTIAKQSGRLVRGSDGRMLYEKRIDLSRLVEILDPILKKEIAGVSYVRITVEARPFDPTRTK